MTVEMACGSCQGRFVVAAAGTVACPHCGTHLMVSSESFPASTAVSTPPEVVAEHTQTPEPVESAPKEPIATTFAGYAGLSESPPSDSNDAVAATTIPPVENSDAVAPETATVTPQEPVAPPESSESPVAPNMNFLDEATTSVDNATISDTIELPDSPPADSAQSDITETLPDFSALNFGGAAPTDDHAPAEFPSFDVESETPTIEFSENEMPSFDFGGGETPNFSVEQEEPTNTAESEERAADTTLPDADPGPTDDGGDEASAEITTAGTEATVVENRPNPAEGQTTAEIPDDAQESPSSVPTANIAADEPGIPRAWFLILASYASAMTIVCIWLLFQMISGKHQLENLKDPADVPKDSKKKFVQLYQIDAKMPRGHVLTLGDSRRFGNILVEPLKVTRGPLQFVHFSSDAKKGTTKKQTEPMLKLWLRLTNQSSDQTIAPLDTILLYTNRVSDDENYALRGNTFVCRDSEKRKNGKLVFVYALNTNDIWDLRDQNLKPLAPGESTVTYIPAGPEELDSLKGDLTWRVHFRKGYSPSKKGVTTLLEVDFDSSDIQADG